MVSLRGAVGVRVRPPPSPGLLAQPPFPWQTAVPPCPSPQAKIQRAVATSGKPAEARAAFHREAKALFFLDVFVGQGSLQTVAAFPEPGVAIRRNSPGSAVVLFRLMCSKAPRAHARNLIPKGTSSANV